MRKLIAGRFEVRETLGHGGMGVVYGALDRERGVEVALKTLRGVTPQAVLRFKNEFRALRDVRHPNLVELGELFENDGDWFFTMELVHGVSFLDWVKAGVDRDDSMTPTSNTPTAVDGTVTVVDTPTTIANRPERRIEEAVRRPAPACDIERLRSALGGLAAGLGALHAAGKVHRDVKPTNLLVDAVGRVVLLDFGVVTELAQAERQIVGTLRYMAPEQTRGDRVGPEADWYAVGGMMFEALTGRPPFADLHGDALIAAKQTLAPLAPSQLADGIPSDLEALTLRLLDPDPARRPSDAEALVIFGAQAATRDDLFVGRHAELEVLRSAFDVSRERAACVVIDGESGVGKSSLVRRFLADACARQPRTLVLYGRCHERERVPFNAIDGLIDDLARFLVRRRDRVHRLIPDNVGALLAVFPALTAVGELVENARTVPSEVRGVALSALRDLLRRIAERRPIVIAIDDLQWADADSLAVLDELLRTDVAPQICVVATKRNGEGEAVLERWEGVQRLSLGGLAPDEAAQLARLVGSDAPHVIAESAGHPLFLRELARHPSAVAGAGLADVLWARVDGLDDATRRLAIAIAVARSPIPRKVAAVAAALGADTAETHLATLAAGHLVRTHGPLPGDPVEPFHDKICDAIAAQLPVESQRAIQLAIARALELDGASPAILLARFDAAGDRERAGRYVIPAATAALHAFAFGRAAELFRRAIDTMELPPDQRATTLVSLGDCLANDGRTGDAAECYLEAALLVPDDERRLDLMRRAAERFLMGGRLEAGLATARAVLDHVGIPLPESRVRTIAGLVWNQLRMRGRALDWQPRPEVRASLKTDICWSIGAGLGMVDTLLGTYFSSHAARFALATGSSLQVTRGMAVGAIGASVLGRRDRAERLLAVAERASKDDGTPLAAWYVRLADIGFNFMLDNAWERMHEHARLLEEEWYAGGHGPGWETDLAMHFSLASLQMLGRYPELARRVSGHVHDAHLRGNLFSEVTLRVRFAFRHLIDGRHELAEKDVVDALAAWMPGSDAFGNQRAWALWSRTRIALYAGRLDADLDDEWQRMRRSLIGRVPLMQNEWFWCYGTYLIGRAIVAQRAGRRSDFEALCRSAERYADRLSRLTFPVAAAMEQAVRAAVAWVRHDPELVPILREALARSYKIPAMSPFLEIRLGQALGGDEGRAHVVAGEAAARRDGWIDPRRAAEIVIPAGM